MDGRDELSYSGDRAALEDFVARLTAAGGAWIRDTAADATLAQVLGRLHPDRADRLLGFHFLHQTPYGGADAQLRLSAPSAGVMRTAVVPVGRPGYAFSPDEWNHLLADFAAHAAPHARAARVEVDGPGPRPVNLTQHTTLATAMSAEMFRSAADPANLTTADHARWRAFTVRAYRDDRPPAADVLREWLSQHGWTAAQIDPLLAEYEDAFQLLHEYEEAARV